MTKDYIKYKNILHCRSCQHFMLMDEYTGDALCRNCLRLGIYKDIWDQTPICKAFRLDEAFRPEICGPSCFYYNSLGCPYLGMDNTGSYCDEWRFVNAEV